jgi:hypothetical protein
VECYLERTADEILGVLAEASKENPRTEVDMFAGDILNLEKIIKRGLEELIAKLSFFSFNRAKTRSEKHLHNQSVNWLWSFVMYLA